MSYFKFYSFRSLKTIFFSIYAYLSNTLKHSATSDVHYTQIGEVSYYYISNLVISKNIFLILLLLNCRLMHL